MSNERFTIGQRALKQKTFTLIFGLMSTIGVAVMACAADDTSTTSGESELSHDAGTTSDSATTSDSGTTSDSATTSDATFTIGGNVTGLVGGGLVLQNNDGDDVHIDANGAFAFPTALRSGSAYAVGVETRPSQPSQTCTVTGAAGTVSTSNVTNVMVSCVTDTVELRGSLSGLAAGGTVALQNNGADELVLTADGSFAFATPIAIGQSYAVTVEAHPTSPRQHCTVINGGGTAGDADVTDVYVSCTNVYTVGGTITGLSDAGLVLTSADGDELAVQSGATSFTLAAPLPSGSSYAVSVKAHPTGVACVVVKESGTIGESDVTNVAISCAPHASYCQMVNGIRWCRDPLQMRSCNTFCSSLGFGNPTISNTEWLMAQDTEEECGQIAAAFGVTNFSVYTYGFGCAEIQYGRLMCSTYAECPQRHRTGSDSTVNAVCPCQ